MPKVLLLGGRAPVALDHARRFTHQGWTVYVADSISCRISASSRAVQGSMRLPSPRHEPAGFVRSLCQAASTWKLDLLVPTCEEVFFVSRYRPQLPASLRVLADDFDVLRTLHSKWHFLALARECGIDVPSSAQVSDVKQAREWAEDRAVVIKPEFSRFGVYVRLYQHGIPADALPFPEQGRWVVQDYVAGNEFASYSVADRGRLLAHSVYRPSHRLPGSASFYFEPACIPRTRDLVQALVRKTGFTGQISFDWIVGPSGQVSALECNPRATSGCHLFEMWETLPDALSGSSSTCLEPSGKVPRMLGPMMLTAGLASAIRSGRVRRWMHDYGAAQCVLLAAGDARPLAGAMADLAAYAGLAIAQRRSMREAATQDIEWNGQPLDAA